MSKKSKGFTLIELLVVISIIAMLASVVMASLSGAKVKARDAQKMVTVKQVGQAIQLMYENTGTVPGNYLRLDGTFSPSPLSSSEAKPAVQSADPNDQSDNAKAYRESMQDLVDAGVLPSIPTSPGGDTYHYFDYGGADGSGANFYTTFESFSAGGSSEGGSGESGGIISSQPSAGKTPPCGNYGDVDDDGYVTEGDVQMVREATVGTRTLTSEQRERADVNNNGEVNGTDVVLIRRYISGYETTFSVCENESGGAESENDSSGITLSPNTDNYFHIVSGSYSFGAISSYIADSPMPGIRYDEIFRIDCPFACSAAATYYKYQGSWRLFGGGASIIDPSTSLPNHFVIRKNSGGSQSSITLPSNVTYDGSTGINGTPRPASFESSFGTAPSAPSVTNNDITNTVSGMTTAMEYAYSHPGAPYSFTNWAMYNLATFNTIDFSGDRNLRVRFPPSGNNPPSEVVTLTFTANTEDTSARRRPPCGNYGDVDNDGWVTNSTGTRAVSDVSLLRDYVDGKIQFTQDQIHRGDVDGNGSIDPNGRDTNLVAGYVIGYYNSFDACESSAEQARRRPPCGSIGDVDGDGWVTNSTGTRAVSDVSLIRDYVDGKIQFTTDQIHNADTNGSGDVESSGADVNQILGFIMGFSSTFPACSSI